MSYQEKEKEIRTLEAEIKTKQKKVDSLKREALQERMRHAPMELADALHETFCHANHTDGCGYMYESWEDYREGGERARWLKKAKKIKALCDLSSTNVNVVLEALRIAGRY